MFRACIKYWLTIILLFLPFQYKIIEGIVLWNQFLGDLLRRLDEITILIFFPLAIIELFKNRELLDSKYILLIFSIFTIVLSGFISGIINGNSVVVTSAGTIEYIKYFLVIFIYAAFIRGTKDFQKIFRLLIIVTVFVGAAALVQELWALYNRYVLDKIIISRGVFLFGELSSAVDVREVSTWRLGIYRADSFMPHYNVLGIYCLLILSIYLYSLGKINPLFMIPICAGIFVSVSRTVYTGFVLMAGLLIINRRRWLILLLIPVLIFIVRMSFLPDFGIAIAPGLYENTEFEGAVSKSELVTEENYRIYAYNKAIDIWRDNPVWGVGPGMFGSPPAIKNRSHIYEEYFFIGVLRGLDQFWPQVLVENGIVGCGAFAGLLITILLILFDLKKKTNSKELQSIYKGLSSGMIAIFIYTFSSTLITVELMFTYCALIGIAIGHTEGTEVREHVTNAVQLM